MCIRDSYINGTPYVLREARGAYTNMKEYSGIDSARLEALEQRLKAEVLAEAAVNAGHVLSSLRAPLRRCSHAFVCNRTALGMLSPIT